MNKIINASEIQNKRHMDGNSEFSHYYFKEQYATIIV